MIDKVIDLQYIRQWYWSFLSNLLKQKKQAVGWGFLAYGLLFYVILLECTKVSQHALLPQGEVEAADRVQNRVAQIDLEGFGNSTNTGACEVECP